MDDRLERGESRRREILGDAYVDASLGMATPFTRDLQEYLTRACWGDIWTRPGLLLRERSLLNLGMLPALGRWRELKLHVRAALTNGLTVDEVKEALLQSAFYCGGPAALDAFRTAAEAVAELESNHPNWGAGGGVVHQAAFTWKKDAPGDVADRVRAALARLRPLLKGVRVLTYGNDLGLNPQTADFAVLGWFVDEPAYRTYAEHPDHQAILRELVLPHAADRTLVQYRA